jgi:hypothetical protein
MSDAQSKDAPKGKLSFFKSIKVRSLAKKAASKYEEAESLMSANKLPEAIQVG